MYKIISTNDMGRGLYATETIVKDQVISKCELLILSELDTVLVNKTDLKYYTFHYNDIQDCLVLGDGEIFNHSDSQNVSYTLEQFEERTVMVFKALRTIEAGEQLFINYEADTLVDSKEYLSKKSLIG